MKVSKAWLKELVNLKVSVDEVVDLLPLRSIGTKEVTDKFFELDMKGYNRADLLSMRGVAREIAGITNSEITFKDTPEDEMVWQGKNLPSTPVNIDDIKLAPIQIVAKIEGVKVGKSPEDWKERITNSGLRPVNNVVDITNLVMFEFGHPLHAFDSSTVKDDTITVRLAKKGEAITTLDGKLRKLEATDIVLADAEKPLDVAGVMGGKDTEIKDSTDTILLSGSLFNAGMVRTTASRLGLHSEASKRFQHGLTPQNLLQSVNAAIKLFESLGGKLTAFTIFYHPDYKQGALENISVKLSNVKELIGVDITEEEVKKYLDKLHFLFASHKKDGDDIEWQIRPPFWRVDIEIEADVIEEIARLYGYEKIPAKELEGEIPAKVDQSLFNLIKLIKESLVELGLTEIQSYSFYSTAVLDALGWDDTNKQYLVKVVNPMSAETEYMRQNVWPNLVEIASMNLRNGFKDVAVFEVGKAYISSKEGLPKENYRLSITLSNDTDNPMPELLTILDKLNKAIGKDIISKGSLEGEHAARLFHPTRNVSLGELGGAAEVHPRVVNALGSDKRIAILEINLEPLL